MELDSIDSKLEANESKVFSLFLDLKNPILGCICSLQTLIAEISDYNPNIQN